jgi:membrane-associated protease RseP (regulator of RpoE activity)
MASVALFAAVLASSFSAFAKFILSVALLAACGYCVAKAFRLECWYGAFLLRSQKGLSFLDRLAKKYSQLWGGLVELGTVIGFGSFAYFLLPRRRLTWRRVAFTYVLGTFLMIVFSYAIAQLATGALFSLLYGGAEFAGAGAKLQAATAQFEFSKHAFFALLALGGISLMVTVGLLIYAIVILAAIAGALLFGTVPLSSISPGGTPIIPGINLPLLEGIGALAVVLIVHESMHGIIARMHGFPLKSAGLVFFGFLPFGAFVDIDEKRLFKGGKHAQSAVFAAGSTANFFTSLAFLLLLFAFSAATEQFRVSGVYVESGSLPHGALIESIGNESVFMAAGHNLSANSTYLVKTDRGEFSLTTDANGKLGVATVLADSTGALGVFRYSGAFEWMAFVMRFLVLAFSLNFVVGAINLVPLPLFDGYYLMKNGVGSDRAAKLIAATAAVAFILNLLPWIFR